MSKGRKHEPVSDAPICAREAFELLSRGLSVITVNGLSVSLDESAKNLLRFLAGCDGHRDAAFGLWGALRELAGDEYEQVLAPNFLWRALSPPAYPNFSTRTMLKDLDDKVEKAARELAKALREHPDFGVESAMLNWPETDATYVAKGLQGLRWPETQDEPAVFDDNGPTVRVGLDRWGIEINVPQNHVFNFVLCSSPTMAAMTDTLAQRAQAYSTQRYSGAKRQTPNKIRLYVRWLIEA
jgi:hypothetical protein